MEVGWGHEGPQQNTGDGFQEPWTQAEPGVLRVEWLSYGDLPERSQCLLWF